MKALIALEDGTIFEGESFTGPGETSGEIVFNTGMSGYQEVLTDPSYKRQIVTMTYPLIGNYGVNEEDMESSRIHVEAFLIKEYHAVPSNFRSTGTLAELIRIGNPVMASVPDNVGHKYHQADQHRNIGLNLF